MANSFIKCFNKAFLVFGLLFFIFISGCGDIDATIASLAVSPSSKTIGINQYQLFSALAKNSVGQIVSADVTWSVTGGIGTITSTGIFTAGSSTGEGTISATTGGVTAEASVVVTDQCWIAGQVIDSKGYKVQDLKVYLEGYKSTYFDFTDSSGKYSISDVPAGTFEVWTDQTSVYRPSSQEVTVASGETETANFTILYFSDPPDLTPPEYTYE